VASLLQKVAAGLLDALDLKTYGRNPTEFSNTVQGSVDILDHYLAPRLRCAATQAAVTAINDSTVHTVPAGVIWRLHGVSGHIDLNAADNPVDGVGIEIDLLPMASTGSCRLATVGVPPKGAAYAAATRFVAGQMFDRPLLLMPGAQLIAALTRTLPAARQLAIVALIEELEI